MRTISQAALLLLLVTSGTGFAQPATTGELTGIATMGDARLVGVTVTATSASLLGGRATLTVANGGYHFGVLPPGTYRLQFTKEGLQPYETTARVFLARVTRADVEMRPEVFTSNVTVEAHSETTDAPGITATFVGNVIEKLPSGRSLRDIVLLAPGARSGYRSRLMISGGPSWDSLFLVNGVVVNENLTGQPHDLFIEDAIDEVSILSGAISAEYGRFTGGVVSALTKSGGNEFTGSLRDTISNPAWTATTPWTGAAAPSDRINHVYEGTLGGFLLKDRLWFFSAARFARSSQQRFTDLTNISYATGRSERRWEGKFTAQIGGRQRIVASYIRTSLNETNLIDTESGRLLEIASLTPLRSAPTDLLAMNYSAGLGANLLLEAQYSKKHYALRGDGGRSTDRITGTFINYRAIRALLNAPNRCGVCGDDERSNRSWVAKASHYSNTRWGNHALVVGGESFAERRINNGNRSASRFNIQTSLVQVVGPNAYPVFDSTTVIGYTPLFVISEGTNLATQSAYLNDRWDVSDRVTLSLGLRYDRNNAHDADGTVVSNDAAISPRVGATLHLDGSNQFSATYGRYTSKILDGDYTAGAAQAAGTFAQFGWRYLGPQINALGTPVDRLLSAPEALARLFSWFDSIKGTERPFFIVYPGYTAAFPQPLESPSMEEFTVGYGSEVARKASLRADIVFRRWTNFYATRVDTPAAQRIDPLGNRVDVGSIVNDNGETQRTYRALQVQGNWRGEQFTFGGGYVWSKLRGNDEGEELTTALNAGPRNMPLKLWYPEFLGYPQRRPIGYLAQDQRHRARIWGSYLVPLGAGSFNVSLLQSFDSGRPYSAAGEIDATGRFVSYTGAPANPGYVLNLLGTQIFYFSDRGVFRTDNVFSTDIALNFERAIHQMRFFIQTDVLNLVDQSAVISVDTEVMTRYRYGSASGLVAFNPFTEVPVEGIHYRVGPNFGKPTGPSSYQTPRTYRFSVGLKF